MSDNKTDLEKLAKRIMKNETPSSKKKTLFALSNELNEELQKSYGSSSSEKSISDLIGIVSVSYTHLTLPTICSV